MSSLVQIKPSSDDVKYLECISHLVDMTQKFHIIFSKVRYVHALRLFNRELSQLLNSTIVYLLERHSHSACLVDFFLSLYSIVEL